MKTLKESILDKDFDVEPIDLLCSEIKNANWRKSGDKRNKFFTSNRDIYNTCLDYIKTNKPANKNEVIKKTELHQFVAYQMATGRIIFFSKYGLDYVKIIFQQPDRFDMFLSLETQPYADGSLAYSLVNGHSYKDDCKFFSIPYGDFFKLKDTFDEIS